MQFLVERSRLIPTAYLRFAVCVAREIAALGNGALIIDSGGGAINYERERENCYRSKGPSASCLLSVYANLGGKGNNLGGQPTNI